MSVAILQIHKRASYEYKYIQDKYAISRDSKTFAIADGTTQSFNSEIWADIITEQFVRTPSFTPSEVIALFKDCVEKYKSSKFEYSANPAMASLEKSKQSKGGTATFFGLSFLSDNKIEIISCGDSNFFLLTTDKRIISYPFSDLDSLDANNYFINTEALVQEKIGEIFFKVKSFDYQLGDKFILATDALSRLLIKKPMLFNELLQINDFEQLHFFCSKYWDNKELQEDDISALIINIDNQTSKKIIIPTNNFSFPKEKEEEFIPASLIQNDTEIKFTDMQMNEIRNQFNGIANDFRYVKKKQKFLEMLVVLAISLVLLSFLYEIFFQSNFEPDENVNEIQFQQLLMDKDNIIQNKQREIDQLNNQLHKRDAQATERETKPIVKNNDTSISNNKSTSPPVPKKDNSRKTNSVEKKKDSAISKQ